MSNSTSAMLGGFVGGIFGVYLFYALWEFVLFKRIMDDPIKGKVSSVVAGYVSISLLYGFLSANGGPFNPSGFLTYLPGFLIWSVFAYRRGERIREQQFESSEADTFA